MVDEYVVHLAPDWRDQAAFIIHVRIDADDPSRQKHWEQLWVKQVDDKRFLVCCIPFFAYDIALADEVETKPEGQKRYVVQRVVKDAGHYTFRVWFGESADPTIREEVMDEVERSGCLFEWSSENLLAISVEASRASEVADYLYQQQQLSRLIYETGRTR
jgi:hypothetical protein